MGRESKETFFALLRPTSAKWVFGVGILLATLGVQAAGLGTVRGEAIIGEPLYVEIPVLGTNEPSLTAGCFHISHPVQPTDAENFPQDAHVKLIKRSGESLLAVATRQLVRTPLVEFRVEMGCGFNVSREYLFLASPQRTPKAAPAPDPAPLMAQASTQTQAAPQTAPIPTVQTAPAPNISATATESTHPLPDGLMAKTRTLDRSMRLDELAKMYFPGPLRRERFMRWVVEANPALFQGATSLRKHQLKKGAAVLVPLDVPPRRPGDHQGNNGRLKFLDSAADESINVQPSGLPQSAPAPVNRPAAVPGKANKKQDRLQISGGASNSLPRGSKGLSFLSDRLGELEGAQAEDKAKVDERFKHLESSLVELSSYVVKLEAKAKEREALLNAERENTKAARERLHLMQLLLAILGGGLLGVLILSALKKKYRNDLVAESSAPMPEILNMHFEDPAPIVPSAAPEPAAHDEARRVEPTFLKTMAFRAEPALPKAQPAPPKVEPAPLKAEPAPLTAELAPPLIPDSSPSTSNLVGNSNELEFELSPPLDLDVEAPIVPVSSLEVPLTFPSQENSADMVFPTKEDEARITLELVDVMVSMGLTDSAAQTLSEHMQEKPRQSPLHWLKLLELFRQLGRQEDFERTANEVRKYFNIHPPSWESSASEAAASLEDYSHIMAVLLQTWNTDDCVNFLYDLITDNRGGAREGFPLAVAEDILLLIAIRSDTQTSK